MYLCKSGFINEFKTKINCRSQKLQIVASSGITSINKINSTLNHPNIIKSILQPLESLFDLWNYTSNWLGFALASHGNLSEHHLQFGRLGDFSKKNVVWLSILYGYQCCILFGRIRMGGSSIKRPIFSHLYSKRSRIIHIGG